ncbi:hypothetical protein AB0K18_42645 [Nonomuraea sp. NPDC049421]|uniref:hypothetical protein n=1 Tax=Nonomuraea sp. NPDC049421 TaxID=3155275 RepID=UPI00342F28BE
MAVLPRGNDLRRLYTDELHDLVNRHGLCTSSPDRDRWAIQQPTARQARRACVGCPLNGVDGACFELAVRLDVARQRKARRAPVTTSSKVTLDQVVYGGQTPGMRARVVKHRLLAAQTA